MYHNSIVPMGMGVGAGMTLPFLDMSPLWASMAAFALLATASAVNRIVPRLAPEGQDWSARAQPTRPRKSGDHGRT
jgi:hypothetical protein